MPDMAETKTLEVDTSAQAQVVKNFEREESGPKPQDRMWVRIEPERV